MDALLAAMRLNNGAYGECIYIYSLIQPQRCQITQQQTHREYFTLDQIHSLAKFCFSHTTLPSCGGKNAHDPNLHMIETVWKWYSHSIREEKIHCDFFSHATIYLCSMVYMGNVSRDDNNINLPHGFSLCICRPISWVGHANFEYIIDTDA